MTMSLVPDLLQVGGATKMAYMFKFNSHAPTFLRMFILVNDFAKMKFSPVSREMKTWSTFVPSDTARLFK